MMDLLLIVLMAGIMLWFWQIRTMAETAKRYITKQCQLNNLQFLSIAQTRAKPFFGGQQFFSWAVDYQFEFSTDGENSYQGQVTLKANKVSNIVWPVYPEPSWISPPNSHRSCRRCG
ncbi:DUF3301 domain-containing protein [Paraferrimonas sp. SM1919]|uniref:DUF3301 domain-containing protein n=1 Tax=Paraferrimonas sp. SM1919 TaxID=2662263 RepID=UPI0013D34D2C|nr:DUF3301 domain-containing protein [Paraferrimonas sp. SM1919]